MLSLSPGADAVRIKVLKLWLWLWIPQLCESLSWLTKISWHVRNSQRYMPKWRSNNKPGFHSDHAAEWLLTHNLDHKCVESLFQKTLHNVFTRFQSGPAFFFPVTFSWASLGTEVWRRLSFVQDLDVFHYSRPRWGYTIPLASNAGRATRGARNKLPLLLGTVRPC